MCEIKNFINFCLLFLTIFSASSTVFANEGGLRCLDLFRDTEQVTKTAPVENRTGTSHLTFTPPKKTAPQVMESALLPSRTRLIVSYDKDVYYENNLPYENHALHMYQETLVIHNGAIKVFREEIAMDPNLPFVINANLAKERRLYDRSLEEGRGIVIFIDLNDLKWINNNFQGKTLAGDQFVVAAAKAIQEMTNGQGLVFRLGGDEFGILMPMMKPEQLNLILKQIQARTKANAEKIFRKEQDLRWTAYQNAKALRQDAKANSGKYSEAQVEEIEAQFITARERMKEFLHYSQPNIAIGAAYYGGQSAEVTQNQVEQNTHPHKMAVKKSNHASIAKYVSNPDDANYEIGPLFVIDYEFPVLPDRTAEPAPTRAPVNWDHPQIQWTRVQVLYHRIGHYNISIFKSDHGILELKVEIYKDNILQGIVDLPMHKHTRLIDAQSQIAKNLLGELNISTTYKGFEIDLLNLGIMNYFEQKSKTGDMALARLARIMKDFFESDSGLVGKKRLGFKLSGGISRYYIEGINQAEIIGTLSVLINSDPVLRKIYEDQINYLISQSSSGAENSAKIESLRQLMNGPFITIKPL